MTSNEFATPPETGDTKRRQWTAMAWLCSAAAIAYLQRNCLGVAESTIRDDLGLTRTETGWILGSFFWSYALLQIPSGRLADRWGARRTLALYAALWSLATMMLVFAGRGLLSANGSAFELHGELISFALVWMIAARLFGGAAQAGVFPCAAIVVAREVPMENRGFATALLGAFQQVGFVIALLATGPFLIEFGWRTTLLIYSIPGLIWAAAYARSFRERKPADTTTAQRDSDVEESAAAIGEQPAAESDAIQWTELLGNRALWCICGQQFCRAFGYIFYASWFPTFLQETRGVSVVKSGFLTAWTIAAAFVGSMLGGTLSDYILSITGNRRLARQGVAIAGLLMCAGLIFLAYFVENTDLAVAIIAAGSFCAALAGPSAYAATIDMGGRNVATVFAVMNMSGNIGAAIFPIVVPYLLKLPAGWDLVLFLFGGVYAAGAVCWIALGRVDASTE